MKNACVDPVADSRLLLRSCDYFATPLAEVVHPSVGWHMSRSRQLHFSQYAALVFLSFFKPALHSLRMIQRASGNARVKNSPGIRKLPWARGQSPSRSSTRSTCYTSGGNISEVTLRLMELHLAGLIE